jgi:hypothetical protein
MKNKKEIFLEEFESEIYIPYCLSIIEVGVHIDIGGITYFFNMRYEFNENENKLTLLPYYEERYFMKNITISYVEDVKKMRQDKIKKFFNINFPKN